ncbi:mediator of RNA polymerase II transcription subunit 12 isoform X2 [Drosophila erecta]|uniref:mediator of RNA polymerase II transcription subunit 12 isoform X2 n=1 Tax=Drosophila erecta TaxID=7220 RepID=UPI000F05EBA2|nr:mediator of RNA polymerase II transcription subunit 12 isoform X2 [Drosophila erecta]
MANLNLMPLIAAATTILTIVSGATATATAGTASSTETTRSHPSYHNMGSLFENRWLPMDQAMQQQHHPNHRYGSAKIPRGNAGERRAFSSSHSSGSRQGLASMLNGLTNLSGLGHVTNGYGSVAPTHTEALALGSSKQEIPIYEEQNEDAAAVAAVAAAGAHDFGSGNGQAGGGLENNQEHSSIYNYPGAGHNGGFLPAYGSGPEQDYAQWTSSAPEEQQPEQQATHPYAYDKISMGNFLPPYMPDSGYDGQQGQPYHQQLQQQQHQQQQHLQQQLYHQQQHQQQEQHPSYFGHHEPSVSGSGSTSAASASSGSGADDFEEHPDAGQEQSSNYLSEASGHGQGHTHHSHHVDIINYVPVKHVKKQHVPVEKEVKIPISHAVIIPVRKPVPIHIPVTKNVQVPVEKELKVPVERLIPVPVEKHIPVPVEKHVPYHVVKYVPIKVPKPFPVKVPVFKTVLHKVKSWW